MHRLTGTIALGLLPLAVAGGLTLRGPAGPAGGAPTVLPIMSQGQDASNDLVQSHDVAEARESRDLQPAALTGAPASRALCGATSDALRCRSSD